MGFVIELPQATGALLRLSGYVTKTEVFDTHQDAASVMASTPASLNILLPEITNPVFYRFRCTYQFPTAIADPPWMKTGRSLQLDGASRTLFST